MLPPAHLRHSLLLSRTQPLVSHALRASATAVLRTSVATTNPRRTFWHWRRSNNNDWTSHLDPLYHRFCRVRTLKTRAKLLRKLQRRGKFEWEGHGAEFFTPKHVRHATRWEGPGGRRPWWIYPVYDNSSKNVDGRVVGKDGEMGKEAEHEDGGFELSQREKIWKEQMEKMRKRIETDPYEAIFGKRFEPFWSPLVPSWMREEMGLPVWKMKSSPEATEPIHKPETESQKAEGKKSDTLAQAKPMETPETPSKTEDNSAAPAKVKPEAPKSTSFSYTSSTSWDSRSNKTRRVEWDSVSGQTKKFEYDPISNRMVLVEAPKQIVTTESIAAASDSNEQTESNKKDAGAINIPVKQSSDLRQSIPIPPPLSQPSHSIPLGFSTTTTTTSVGPLKSTAVTPDVAKSTAIATDAPKPSALTKFTELEKTKETAKQKEDGLESLTADFLRANMVRPRLGSSWPNGSKMQIDARLSARHQVDALLSERHISSALPSRTRHDTSTTATKSEWDKAELSVLYDKELESLNKKKEKLLNDEKGLFHIERQKRELTKLDTRIKELVERVEKLNENAVAAADVAQPEKTTVGLQSSLDRMQNKPFARPAVDTEDADDSAAHESTEPVTSVNTSARVPRGWAKQADLLQADRVRRSADFKGLYPLSSNPSQTKVATPAVTPADIAARKKANEARRAAEEAKAAEEVAKIKAEKQRLEREQKLEKANAMLEAEVKEQKFLMQAHENRYAHKIRALRGELETAYKQSAVHGEKHLERIRDLEDRAMLGKTSANRYTQKIKALKDELDVAYRQSAVHGEKHVERIRSLEAELEKSQKAIGEKPTGAAPHSIESEAVKDVKNWYQQATTKTELEKSKIQKTFEQQKKDRELVKEIRGIYEKQYGTIDAQHRQTQVEKQVAPKPQVVEVESDVDLGEALAKYENDAVYRVYKSGVDTINKPFGVESDVGLREALAKYEKEYDHYGAKRSAVDSTSDKAECARQEHQDSDATPGRQSSQRRSLGDTSMRQSEKLLEAAREREVNEGVKLVDDTMPRLIPTEMAKPSSSIEAESKGVQWAIPPLYKVLAYDSGNDMMSTATTTSNFTGTETPISIPEALSQLYAPARFVGAFAELQKEGYQVIYGTKDLLVFRKVAESIAPEVQQAARAPEDHNVVAGGQWRAPMDDVSASMSKRDETSGVDFADAKSEILTKETPMAYENVARMMESWNRVKVDSKSILPDESQNVFDSDTDWRHYPRVKREEYPVFTGTRRKWQQPHPALLTPSQQTEKHDKRERRERRKRRRAVWRTIMGTGVIGAGVAYCVGAVEEKSRKSDVGRTGDEWAKKVEEAEKRRS